MTCPETTAELLSCPDEGMFSLDSAPHTSSPRSASSDRFEDLISDGDHLPKLNDIIERIEISYKRVRGATDLDERSRFMKEFQTDLSAFEIYKDRLLRLTQLENCWGASISDELVKKSQRVSQLESGLSANDQSRGDEEDRILRDVSSELHSMRKWLRFMELAVSELDAEAHHSKQELRERLDNQKALQAKIESKTETFRKWTRYCEQLKRLEGDRVHLGLKRTKQHSEKDRKRIIRTVESFENRWHKLWLCSLERQCFIEQQLGVPSRPLSSLSSSGSNDEPLCKIPRLNAITPEQEKTSRNSEEIEATTMNRRNSGSGDLTRIAESPDGSETSQPTVPVPIDSPVNLEGIQDVGYSSESSTRMSNEEPPPPAYLLNNDVTPESPELPSRDSGLSSGGSPRKFPLLKTSPVCDPLEEYILEEDIRSPPMRVSGDFYTITTVISESENETAKTPPVFESNRSKTGHSLTIDNQVVQLRKPVPRTFAPLKLEKSEPAMPGREKATRIREWLNKCDDRPVESVQPLIDEPEIEQDSCDASGELTNDSETEENDIIKSTSTLNAPADEVCGAADLDSPPRVQLRNQARKRRSRDRPWSVTELPNSTNTPARNLNPMSTSLTALDNYVGISPLEDAKTASSGSEDDSQMSRYARHSSVTLCEASSIVSAQKREKSELRKRRSSQRMKKRSLSSSMKPKSDGLTSTELSDVIRKDENRDRTRDGDEDRISLTSSENMWDNYQDPLYLSEQYSEKEIDDETMKKLLNFGDDYKAFIGSMSDASTASESRETIRRQRKKEGIDNTSVNCVDDHEDKTPVLAALRASEEQFSRVSQSSPLGENLNGKSVGEIIQTCLSNIGRLQFFYIEISTTNDERTHLNKLLDCWRQLLGEIKKHESNGQTMAANTVNRIKDQEIEIRHDMGTLRGEVGKLKEDLLREERLLETESLNVAEHLQSLKSLISRSRGSEDKFLRIKVRVHRVMARDAQIGGALSGELKELFDEWFVMHKSIQRRMIDLQQPVDEPPATICAAMPIEPSARHECGSKMTNEKEMPVSKLQLLRAEMTPPSDANMNIKPRKAALEVDKEEQAAPVFLYSEVKESKKAFGFWTTFKAAIPIQVALVMLYCVTYLMDSKCCDSMNTWATNVGPQLRYEQGHPPI